MIRIITNLKIGVFHLVRYVFLSFSSFYIKHFPFRIFGLWIFVHPNHRGIAYFLWRGMYENYTISEIPKWVKRGGLVLDVGAHVGIITLILSRLVGVSGKVVSFEPDPFTSKFFDKNLSWNKISNVTLVRAGVGKKDGSSRLYRSSEDPADNRLFNSDNRSESVTIKIVTLDSQIKDKVDFIKIDVQGLETEVIFGASKLIKKYKPVLLIEFWPEGLFAAKSSPFALYKIIKKHGYSIYALDDIYKKKIKIKNLDQLNSLCKTIGFINILCV